MAVEVGGGVAGVHGVDPDAGERLGVLHRDDVDRGLGGRVGDPRVEVQRTVRVGQVGRLGQATGQVDHDWGGGTLQHRQERMQHPDHAEHVGVEQRLHVPGGLIRRADHAVVRGAAFDARVVDQDVEPAVGLDRLGRRRDQGVVGHVEVDKPCAEPLGGPAAALRVAGPDVDGVACSRQLPGGLVAQALVRSGNECRGHESFSWLVPGSRVRRGEHDADTTPGPPGRQDPPRRWRLGGLLACVPAASVFSSRADPTFD